MSSLGQKQVFNVFDLDDIFFLTIYSYHSVLNQNAYNRGIQTSYFIKKHMKTKNRSLTLTYLPVHFIPIDTLAVSFSWVCASELCKQSTYFIEFK